MIHLLIPLALFACNDKADDSSSPGGSGAPLTVATYNAGLATGFVPATEDRAPRTAEATAGIDAEIVCLQEVWTPEQVAMFESAASDSFPYQYFPEAQQVTEDEAACEDPDLLNAFTECVDTYCDADCADELVECVFSSCVGQFIAIGLSDKDCQGCVMANVGGTTDDVNAACLDGDTWYAYGGSFGTGILSAHPLSDVDEYVFDSTSNRRSLLHAIVDAPAGEVDLYCTHLTAVFATIPYPKEEGSWQEEQAVQIQELVDHVDSSSSTGMTVLLGDFNMGPAVGDSKAVQEDNWDVLAGSGMDTPYIDAEGECTYCIDNPINDTVNDEIIDHILTDGFKSGAPVERLLTDAITAERCGNDIDAAYSDHYGIKATITPVAQ